MDAGLLGVSQHTEPRSTSVQKLSPTSDLTACTLSNPEFNSFTNHNWSSKTRTNHEDGHLKTSFPMHEENQLVIQYCQHRANNEHSGKAILKLCFKTAFSCKFTIQTLQGYNNVFNILFTALMGCLKKVFLATFYSAETRTLWNRSAMMWKRKTHGLTRGKRQGRGRGKSE